MSSRSRATTLPFAIATSSTVFVPLTGTMHLRLAGRVESACQQPSQAYQRESVTIARDERALFAVDAVLALLCTVDGIDALGCVVCAPAIAVAEIQHTDDNATDRTAPANSLVNAATRSSEPSAAVAPSAVRLLDSFIPTPAISLQTVPCAKSATGLEARLRL
jgi:hypothetical protein